MADECKPKRLCSEIQLFDLCEKDVCTDRDDRYCRNSEILAKFEAISEEDDSMQDRFLADEDDEMEDYDDLEDEDGSFGGDGYEGDDE